VPMLGYGGVDIRVIQPNGSKGNLSPKEVAFRADFNTNLVSSLDLLQEGD
jgi:hypothetical protein